MTRVVITEKRTRSRLVLFSALSEAEAERICEAWGWIYTDENNVSYWMGYEDEDKEDEKE